MSIKKRVTKSIALALAGITLAIPMLNTVSANEKKIETMNIKNIENVGTIDKEYIESKLIEEGITGVELVGAPNVRSTQKTIDFNTEEEFIDFLKTFKTEDSIENDMNQSRISTSGKLKWYSPFSGWGVTGIANWKNIWFNYDYTKNSKGEKLISKVSNVTSDITGIQIAVSWNPKSTSTSISKDKKSCKFTIDGYYLLGVTIGGTPIGAKISNTWNRTFNAN